MLMRSFKSWNWCWTCVCLCSWIDCLVRFQIVGFISLSLQFELLVRSMIAFSLVFGCWVKYGKVKSDIRITKFDLIVW